MKFSLFLIFFNCSYLQTQKSRAAIKESQANTKWEGKIREREREKEEDWEEDREENRKRSGQRERSIEREKSILLPFSARPAVRLQVIKAD